MTDKVQKIKEWISKEQEGLMDANGNFEYPEHEGAYHILCNLDTYIDSLQEESVSEDMEDASRNYADNEEYGDDVYFAIKAAFKAGAKWQKEQMTAKAIDVEVKVDAGGYPYIPQLELYDYDNDVPLAKEGDKYKVVLIKED